MLEPKLQVQLLAHKFAGGKPAKRQETFVENNEEGGVPFIYKTNTVNT